MFLKSRNVRLDGGQTRRKAVSRQLKTQIRLSTDLLVCRDTWLRRPDFLRAEKADVLAFRRRRPFTR